MKLRICYTSRVAHSSHRAPAAVPPGHVPVHVGEATEPTERFTIRAEMLNRPVFVGLLDRTARELGYQHSGALRILCAVSIFRQLLLALSSGGDARLVAPDIFAGEIQAN